MIISEGMVSVVFVCLSVCLSVCVSVSTGNPECLDAASSDLVHTDLHNSYVSFEDEGYMTHLCSFLMM